MSWLTDWVRGRNGKASKTKIVAATAAVLTAVNTIAPGLIPAEVGSLINSVLLLFGGIAVKDAIDKTAPVGTEANPR